jgi:hypothetical protein
MVQTHWTMTDSRYFEGSPLASELRRDIESVRTFWEQFPGELVDLKITPEEGAHITILLWSRDNHDREDLLREQLIHCDDLEIQYSKWSLSHLEDIQAQLQQMATTDYRESFLGWGQSGDAIDIGLCADQESLAARLHVDYGSAVDITVGNFQYPPDSPPRSSWRRPQFPVTSTRPKQNEAIIPNLEVALHLSSPTVLAGKNGGGNVIFRNTGIAKIEFESGSPLVGEVVDPVTGETVGGFIGAIAGVGKVVSLSTDEETSIPFLFGTASFRIEMGYSLPPGEYLVSVQVPVSDCTSDSGDHQRRIIQAPPARFTVEAS